MKACDFIEVESRWRIFLLIRTVHCWDRCRTNANKVYVALGEYDYSGVYFYENEGLSANIAR